MSSRSVVLAGMVQDSADVAASVAPEAGMTVGSVAETAAMEMTAEEEMTAEATAGTIDSTADTMTTEDRSLQRTKKPVAVPLRIILTAQTTILKNSFNGF